MNFFWWLGLIGLLLATRCVLGVGEPLIQRMTGRTSQRPQGSHLAIELYEFVYVGVMLGISMPPIFLLPNADPLVYGSFFALGMVVGGFAAQAFFGRKVA